MNGTVRKVISLGGMLLLGDVAAYALGPQQHLRVWRFSREPRWYRWILEASANLKFGALAAMGEAVLGTALLRLAQREA
jgi:hypothetical protein